MTDNNKKHQSGNPKGNPDAADRSNTAKDPREWVTKDEPMTGAQASYLKTLSEETGEDFDPGLSKAEASQRIEELKSRDPRLGRKR